MGNRTRRDGGASLVEFALVVPILTLFLFGIVQFGLAFDQKQSINSAAREGARTAAIQDDSVTYTAIRARVDSSFQGLASDTVDNVIVEIVDPATGTPTVAAATNPCKDNAGQTVRVTAINTFVATIPFFGTIEPDLTGVGEFRCEIDA